MGCLGALILIILGGAALMAIGELVLQLMFGAAIALVYIVAGIAVAVIVIVLFILWAIMSLFKGD